MLEKHEIFHYALGKIRTGLSFFSEMLGKDWREEASGEESEKKKWDKCDGDERNINPV